MGTEAEVYAAEASDKNDLLEKILPANVDDYIDLVRAHLNAGVYKVIWLMLVVVMRIIIHPAL